MEKNLDAQVLSRGDLDEVLRFIEARFALRVPDEQERMFASWKASWRKESLEHYLPLGWSFALRTAQPDQPHTGKMRGVFLGQPLLFFRSMTQTLWIEHIESESSEITRRLLEIAYGIAREKHLQRLLIQEPSEFPSELESHLTRWNAHKLSDSIWEVQTSKA